MESIKYKKAAVQTAFGGIITALTVMLVYLSSVLPTGRLFLLFTVSLLPGIMLFKRWVRATVIAYCASSLLSLFIITNPLYPIAYIAFFGLFPLVRHGASHFKKTLTYVLAMYLFSNVSFFICLLIAKYYLNIQLSAILPLGAMVALVQVVIILYIYLYDVLFANILKLLSPMMDKFK